MERAKRKQVLGNPQGRTTRHARQLAADRVTSTVEITPGVHLYRAVRAALLLRGMTFVQFCEGEGVERGWAQQALTGERDGKKAKALRKQLVEAAGLDVNSIN